MTTYRQPDLFDADAAVSVRDSAIARVGARMPEYWSARASAALYECAARQDEFIVDDVWRLLDPSDVPPEPRAMGAVIRSALERGIIEPTGRYMPSDRRSAHRNPRQIWRASR